MQVTERATWNHCESVKVRNHNRMPLWRDDIRELYLWLLFNVGVQGRDWEESRVGCQVSEKEFIFADPKHATLFTLRWGHVICH